MKKVFLFCLILFILSACSDSSTNPYNQKIIQGFVSSCTAPGNVSEKDCHCIINKIQEQITQEEYIELETKYVISKQMPPKFLELISEARSQCLFK